MKLKHWLIKKLGGYVLDEEQKSILLTFSIQRLAKEAEKKIEKDLVDVLFSGFTASYGDDSAPLFSERHPSPQRTKVQSIINWLKVRLIRPKITQSNLGRLK